MKNKKDNNFLYAIKLLKKFGIGYTAVSILLSAFEMVIPIVNIYGLKVLLDSIEQGKSFGSIMRFIGFLFLLMGVSYIFSTWFKKYYSPVQVQKIRLNMRRYFYAQAAKTDLKYYDDTNYYNKYVKALSEGENRLFQLIKYMANLVGTISSLIAIVTLAISMDYMILVFSIVSVAISILLSMAGQNYSIKENNEAVSSRRRFDYVNRIFYQRQYAKEIRSYSLKDNLGRLLEKAGKENIAVIEKYVGKQSLLMLLMSFCNITYLLGMMAYLSFRAIGGAISVGDFAALLTAAQNFNSQLEELFNVIPNIRETVIYIGFLREFENNQSEIETKTDGYEMEYGAPAAIQLEGVGFRYPNTQSDILHGINEQIQKEEVIAVVGENGVGKSTLLKLLLRLYDTTEGEIKYNGIPIREYNVASLRRNIGIVFQDFQHYAMTIRENLCFNQQGISDEEIYQVLSKVGMGQKVKKLPLGLDTMVSYEFDQNGVEFSGGEYQKLALARAILLKQGMVILDEPSSSFDPNSEKQFFDNMKQLCKGKTAIIVSHRLAAAKFADRILLIKDGRIAESGTHSELMALGGEYSVMYKNQMEN